MKKILFVDDEQSVLDGLRNLLRSRRREWDMVFARGAEQALSQLDATPFDVVISDMRMPHMDGAALLARVKDLRPRAVRIVLSGQTEQDSVMKTVFVAHQFLAKPCDPVALQHTVERACQMNSIINSEAVCAALGQIATLPAAPRTFLALQEVLARPNASVRDIVALVERDIALSAKILQMVNSAFFGLPRRISALAEAVTYLGVSTIKNLTLALEAFASSGPGSDVAPEELQRHSLLTGHLARRIMAGETKDRADQAFAAGLLHDIGRLIKIPDPVPIGPEGCFDPPIVGAYLLGIWGLPHAICEAVAYHQAPGRIEHAGFDLVDAVHLANRLAEQTVGGREDQPEELAYLATRGMTEDKLAQWSITATELAAQQSQRIM